jgi:hypothetical protein
MVSPGQTCWVSNPGTGANLVNLANEGPPQACMPDPCFSWLHATRADGTLFVSTANPLGPSPGPVMMYTPHALDSRVTLAARDDAIEVADDGCVCVASDATIWAATTVAGSGAIQRFDGHSWQTLLAADHDSTYDLLIPGRDGWVLAETVDGHCTLLHPAGNGKAEPVDAPSLAELIEHHAPAVQAAFAGTTGSDSWPLGCGLAVDRAGAIWLLQAYKLRVRVADHWLEPEVQIKVSAPSCMTALDDGRVYLTNLLPASSEGTPGSGAGASFFASVREGRLVFQPAPHARAALPNPRWVPPARPQSGLWIGGSTDDQPPAAPRSIARLLGPAGTVPTLIGMGLPRLVDPAGNLWTIRRGPAGQVQYTIFAPTAAPDAAPAEVGTLSIPSPSPSCR